MVQKPIFFEQVKSCILSFHNANEKCVTDETQFLQSLCEAIESVLRMGLKCSHRLIKRKDYWNWMKSIPRICEKWEIFVHPSYLQAINHVHKCRSVTTAQGRGRLLIRMLLSSGTLDFPFKLLLNNIHLSAAFYEESESVMGNDILIQIFSSLVSEVCRIPFNLNVDNTEFLDETWCLPTFKTFTFVPCKYDTFHYKSYYKCLESKMERKLQKEMAETQSLQTREKRLKMSTSIVDGLHCVHTALSIISSSDASDVLTTDPTAFCNHLYTILGRIAGVGVSNITESDNTVSHLSSVIKAYDRSNTPAAQAVANLVQRSKITESSNKTTCSDEVTSVTASISNRISAYEMEHISDTLISCLNILLVRRKHEVSTNRILAFSKRLASAALAVSDPYCSSSLLIKLFHLLRLFPRCEILFDCDPEICSNYKPDVNDPELCFPASACLWDLLLLKKHSDPVVNQLANLIMQWGNDVCVGGIGATSTKQYILHIDGRQVSLDHLTHLSSDDLRIELKTLIEKDISVPEIQSTKQINTSDFQLSDSFIKYLSEYDLTSDVEPPAKKMKSL
ncbi:unnamed protein product [Schistosoma mattheei]|uniref:Uncharacterized protein n=1 Tax=Schistosoma mattheei TaxID=31246 RepID=A0A183P5L4_9TREM|nr:unnamed protein product [Schistosoma mattheei]